VAQASRWKWMAGLLAGGLIAAGAGRISAFQEVGGDPEDVKAEARPRGGQRPQSDPDPAGPQTIAELADARVKSAHKLWETHRTYFEQGMISIDRYIDASRCLMESERDAARTKADEIAALRGYLERMRKIEERERAKREVGSGTIPNVQEAEYHRREAEYWLARAQAGHDGGPRPSPR
jgi:hypothetical protein